MSEPVSLEEARRNKKRAGKAGGSAPPDGNLPPNEDGVDEYSCPITPLGYADGKYWFLNIRAERRCLSARQLSNRSEVVALFMGHIDWLEEKFLAYDSEGNRKGFSVPKAYEYLMRACDGVGMYGDHIIIRKPGVWAGENGAPVAHCGDALFVSGRKTAAGVKIAGQVFAAAPREIYPADMPAAPAVAQGILEDIRTLWDFRDDGAEIIAVGLVGQAYLAAALDWRANGFLTGAKGSGKSELLHLLHAMVPISHYSTDTTKAGIESAVNGRALPSFLDEAADRGDGEGAARLMDVVLSSSSGSGTKGHRGTADGGVRTIEMVGSVIMASISPPAMQPQHRSRFSMIELLPPAQGADNKNAMKAATARAKAAAPALFARALAGHVRYGAALGMFRRALGREGCVAREMDQVGAVLSGYWILTQDGVPDEDVAAEVVRDIKAFVRGGDDMGDDDAPQLVLAKFLTHVVTLHRSTDTDTMAVVIEAAMKRDLMPGDATDRERACSVLGKYGVRPVRAEEITDPQNKDRAIPRLGPGNGLWLNPRADQLRKIFAGTPYEGDRWLFEILRLPSAKRAKSAVRIAKVAAKAVWISWDDIYGKADDG